MEPTEHTDKRLTELEIKVAFTEDLVEHLNDLVFRQQAQLDSLRQEISTLRQQSDDGGGAGVRSLRDELPPHY